MGAWPVFHRARPAGLKQGGRLPWQTQRREPPTAGLWFDFGAVERMGQRLPDPLTLFFGMGALVVLVSALFVGGISRSCSAKR